MEKQKKGLAIAALVLGIIGLALSFLPIINNAAFIFGVIGLVLGIVALFRKNQKVLTIIAIVMNVLAMGITLALQNSWSKALDDASKEIDKMFKQVVKGKKMKKIGYEWVVDYNS